jgi:SWIM zinc finger
MADITAWQPDIRAEGGGWFSIQSESAPGCRYMVDANVGACNCPAFVYGGRRCKHIGTVREFGKTQQPPNLSTEVTMPTKEQSELLMKLAESAGRFASLAPKAKDIGCESLAKDLETIAKHLAVAIDLQHRVFSPDVQVRTAALAESELPFRVL